ncbi:MAG: rRNA maturation RNase YbeY [Flavobacteriaceae bacterium]
MKSITIQTQNEFSFGNQDRLVSWLENCVLKLHRQVGEIHIALMSDDDLLLINQKYLDHDDYTDVITFDYSTETTINCDIAISTDRVTENATQEGVSLENELGRVMIHGLLHCVGYIDKSPEDKTVMRKKENEMLKSFHVEQKG